MLEKFKFIFKDLKKASRYAQMYNKYAQNPFLKSNNKITENTYIWVEKLENKD